MTTKGQKFKTYSKEIKSEILRKYLGKGKEKRGSLSPKKLRKNFHKRGK